MKEREEVPKETVRPHVRRRGGRGKVKLDGRCGLMVRRGAKGRPQLPSTVVLSCVRACVRACLRA